MQTRTETRDAWLPLQTQCVGNIGGKEYVLPSLSSDLSRSRENRGICYNAGPTTPLHPAELETSISTPFREGQRSSVWTHQRVTGV